jgi:NAD dependent epimerase/dehydratase family enzyme
MPDSKRVVVTGATGLIGKALCKELIAKGYQVVVFSRDPQRARKSAPGAAEYIAWQPAERGAWTSAVDGAHGVIHLAGASLFGKRWSAAYKRDILESREVGTRGLVNAMAQAGTKPQVFVSSSAVGYYGPREDTKLDESAPPGNDFLARVCQVWEREAAKAEDLGIRTVIVRTGVIVGSDEGKPSFPIDLRGASLSRPGVVLNNDEGALPLLMLPFRLYVGGPVLPGTQWLPWIHIADEVGILMLALEDERVRGPINATAPEPQTNRDFAKVVGRTMRRPSFVPVPGFALKLLLGEMASIITTGQRAIPKKVQALGYQFKYPTSEQALRQILGS